MREQKDGYTERQREREKAVNYRKIESSTANM